jgi:hypothetical protein
MEERCPWCGGELENGTLRSNGSNFFLPDGEKACKVRFYTKGYIEKARAIALPPDPYGGLLEKPQWPKACVCRSCKKIIIPY